MLLNNYFSKKNKLLYKMKIMNSRNQEYEEDFNDDYDRIQKYNDKKQIIIDELAELSLNKKYVLPPYSEEIINELISTINIEREKARTIQAFKEGSKGKSQSEQALQAQNYLNKKRAMIEHLENKK